MQKHQVNPIHTPFDFSLLTLCFKGPMAPGSTTQARSNAASRQFGARGAATGSLEKMTKQMSIQQQFQFVTDEDDEEISLKVQSIRLWV